MSKYLHKSPLSHICTNHSLRYIHSVNIWWRTSNSHLAITWFGAMPPAELSTDICYLHWLLVLSFSVHVVHQGRCWSFVLKLLETFSSELLSYLFVFISCIKTNGLYLLVGLPFIMCVEKPTGSLCKCVEDGCSCLLLCEDMHIVGRVPQMVSVTFANQWPLVIGKSLTVSKVGPSG